MKPPYTFTTSAIESAAFDTHEALQRLVRECCSQISAARCAELNARARADRLAQILTGAAGLASEVMLLASSHNLPASTVEVARMVARAIARLPEDKI